MSHFTTVKTKINNLSALVSALEEMGRRPRVAAVGESIAVRGWMGNRAVAEVVADFGNGYDVGAVRAADGENYNLVADWSMIGNQAGHVEEITRRYAYHRVIESCAAEGFQIDPESIERSASGEVKLVAIRWD